MSSANKECCLMILCGIPACGKTTLSLKLKQWLMEIGNMLPIIISYDKLMPKHVESSLINQQSRLEDESSWKKYRDHIINCVNHFINQYLDRTSSENALKFKTKEIGVDPSVLNLFRKMVYDQINEVPDDVDNESEQTPGMRQNADRETCEGRGDKAVRVTEEDRGLSEQIKEINGNGVKDNIREWMTDKKLDELRKDKRTLVVIIDDNMYYRSMRYNYYQLARNNTIGFCEIYINCDVELAIYRNTQRMADQVNPDIIHKMVGKFEIPDKSQYSWEKFSLNCNTDKIDKSRSDIISLIHTAIMNPIQPIGEIDPDIIAESQRICSTNLIHQADLILRQLISYSIRTAKDSNKTKSELKSMSRKLSDIKAIILQELREGIIKAGVCEENIKNSSNDNTSLFYGMIEQKFHELNT